MPFKGPTRDPEQSGFIDTLQRVRPAKPGDTSMARKPRGGDESMEGAATDPDARLARGGNTSYRGGGKIKHTSGPRIGKDDGLIPAQKGEFVVRKSAVNKLGTKALNQINRGKLPAKGKR